MAETKGMSTMELANAISSINAQLTENGYSSIDPILQNLKVENAAEAINILGKEFEIYSSSKFHPLASQVARNLAFLYKSQNETEKWLDLMCRCLSPIYQRFLPSDVQDVFLSNLSTCSPVSIKISELSASPFGFSFGFIAQETRPSEDVQIVFDGRSFLLSPITINSISITFNHSKESSQTIEILKDVSFSPKRIFRTNTSISYHSPGTLAVSSVLITISNATLELPLSHFIGHSTATILPVDSECIYSIECLSFAMIGVDFPVRFVSQKFPQNAQNIKISAKIENGPLFYSEGPEGQTEINVSDVTVENGEFILPAKLNCNAVCKSRLNAHWEFTHETILFTHDETINIQFFDPFAVSPKLFTPERIPMSLKTPPQLTNGYKYIIVTTFEYNLPSSSILTQLNPIPNENFEFVPVPFDLPLSLSQSEAFTSVIFATPLNSSSDPSIIGNYILKYSIADDQNSEIEYKVSLPAVFCSPEVLKLQVNIPSEVIGGADTNGSAILTANDSIDIEFKISEHEGFVLSGETRFACHLEAGETKENKFVFVASQPGRQIFPKITVAKAGNDVSIAEAAPSVFVRFPEISTQ